jgi:hypothetical protein
MSTTKLPTEQRSHSLLYDGNDRIYIMGGDDGSGSWLDDSSVLDQILVYSISSQNITRIGSLPSTPAPSAAQAENT